MGYRMFVIREGRPDQRGYAVLTTAILNAKDEFEAVDMEKECFLDDGRMDAMNRDDVRGLLQAMSDAAWEVGIKPKQIEDNSNELKATKFHLEDMRQLAGVKK